MHFFFFLFIFVSPLLGCLKSFNLLFIVFIFLYYAYCTEHTPILAKVDNFKSNVLALWSGSFFRLFFLKVLTKLYVGDIYLYMFSQLNVFNFFFFSWSFVCRLILVLYLILLLL